MRYKANQKANTHLSVVFFSGKRKQTSLNPSLKAKVFKQYKKKKGGRKNGKRRKYTRN